MNLELTTLLCKAINTFGDGQHPVAEPSTIEYFSTDYSIDCIDKALDARSEFIDPHDNPIVKMLNEIKNSLIISVLDEVDYITNHLD
jgi:hypothetical protein